MHSDVYPFSYHFTCLFVSLTVYLYLFRIFVLISLYIFFLFCFVSSSHVFFFLFQSSGISYSSILFGTCTCIAFKTAFQLLHNLKYCYHNNDFAIKYGALHCEQLYVVVFFPQSIYCELCERTKRHSGIIQKQKEYIFQMKEKKQLKKSENK